MSKQENKGKIQGFFLKTVYGTDVRRFQASLGKTGQPEFVKTMRSTLNRYKIDPKKEAYLEYDDVDGDPVRIKTTADLKAAFKSLSLGATCLKARLVVTEKKEDPEKDKEKEIKKDKEKYYKTNIKRHGVYDPHKGEAIVFYRSIIHPSEKETDEKKKEKEEEHEKNEPKHRFFHQESEDPVVKCKTACDHCFSLGKTKCHHVVCMDCDLDKPPKLEPVSPEKSIENTDDEMEGLPPLISVESESEKEEEASGLPPMKCHRFCHDFYEKEEANFGHRSICLIYAYQVFVDKEDFRSKQVSGLKKEGDEVVHTCFYASDLEHPCRALSTIFGNKKAWENGLPQVVLKGVIDLGLLLGHFYNSNKITGLYTLTPSGVIYHNVYSGLYSYLSKV